MRFVIMLTVLRPCPELPILHPPRILAEFAIVRQTAHNVEQIYCWVVARCLSARVTQEPFIVKLFHVLHRLLWTDAQFARDKLLRLNRVQWERPVAQLFLLLNGLNLCLLCLLNHLKKH